MISQFSRDSEFACKVAELAADVLRPATLGKIERKIGTDIVTEADLRAESVILGAIATSYPDDEILAEESGEGGLRAPRRWCVDPLDGTVNFANGIPYFAVSIGLEDELGGAAAAIYDPSRNEMFSTYRGSLTAIDSIELTQRPGKSLADSVVAVQLPEPQWFEMKTMTRMLESARGTRLSGSTALDLAWTAIGRYDLCLYRRTLQRWDWVAGEFLVSTSPGNAVLSLGKMGDLELMAAGNEDLAEEVRGLLSVN